MEHPEGDCGGGEAAGSEQGDDPPGNQATAGKVEGAACFGESGKQQVGTDRQVRLDPEEEDQDGGHERSPTHAGQSDGEADREAGNDEGK